MAQMRLFGEESDELFIGNRMDIDGKRWEMNGMSRHLIASAVVAASQMGSFIDDDHLCFCVGDVSGKGVPAALFMAVGCATSRTRSPSGTTRSSATTPCAG